VPENPSNLEEFTEESTHPLATALPGDSSRTKVIVRLGHEKRMVTKGYQKGVYDRVTMGTRANSQAASDFEDLTLLYLGVGAS